MFTQAALAAQPGARLAELKVTGGLVIEPATGLTQLDRGRCFDSVAKRILPHLAEHPLALLRRPEDVVGTLFFQRYDEASSIPGLQALDPGLVPRHRPLVTVPVK